MIIDGHEVFTATSIGITVYPTDDTNPDQLLKNADLALYQAKAEGRNTFQFYDSRMNQRAQARKNMERDLRQALERDELQLYYQPRVNIKTGEMVGAEALLRWQHPEKGMVPPNEFIPIAESTGLIMEIGAWVLNTACAQHVAWRDAGLSAISVAVNLSAVQFRSASLIETVSQAIKDTGIEPSYLELEITESMIMDRIESVLQILQWFRNLGIQMSIDDFGTGYCSLGYLKRFPVNNLKIDRSFVRGVIEEEDDAAIVKTIITLSRNLGLKVVAEGVETNAQLEFLRQQGCEEAQGYYFSRPVPADQLIAWHLQDQNDRLLNEGNGTDNPKKNFAAAAG